MVDKSIYNVVFTGDNSKEMGTNYSLLYTYMPGIMLSAMDRALKNLFPQETYSLMKQLNRASIIFYCEI